MSNAPSSGSALFRTEGLCKLYPDGQVWALNDVTMEIHRGEYTAVMGPSGSGKSTLLNILGALDIPTKGEVCFEGQALSAMRSLDAFRCEQIGSFVSISCGLSHPVLVRPEAGVDVKVETVNRVVVSGIDKELVGDVAARIRAVRPVKPYIFRGDFQGIRYDDERPRRKAGKQGV